MSKDFVVYRRSGDRVIPFAAQLVKSSKGWKDGKPYGINVRIETGREIPWPELYAGHTTWVGERIAATKQAIKSERARRSARKAQQREPAGAPVVETASAA